MSATNSTTREGIESGGIAGVPNGRMAMWWVIASEVVIFGGFVTTYVLNRVRFVEWGEHAAHTSTPLGALNTFILLTSSLTAVLAHDRAERKDTAGAARLLWATIGFGLGFLVVKTIEYTTEVGHGFTPATNLFWSYYYGMTALHALHVIAGMIAMIAVMGGVRRGENLHRVEMVGLYWHFVDIVWIFLFPLLYVAK